MWMDKEITTILFKEWGKFRIKNNKGKDSKG